MITKTLFILLSIVLLSGGLVSAEQVFASTAATFTAEHTSTITTKITFNESTTGTLLTADWTVGGNAITGIQTTGGGDLAGTSSAQTDIVLVHAAIPPDSTLNVNFISGNLAHVSVGNSLPNNYNANAADKIVPAFPTSLDLITDSGFDTNDNITNINNPTITGIGEAYSLAQLFVDGKGQGTNYINNPGGTWSIISGALSDGTHDFTAKILDQPENQSVASSTLSVTIDTTAPTATLSYSDSDKVFKDGQVVLITADFNEPLADSPLVKLAIDNNELTAAAMIKINPQQYTFFYTVQSSVNIATATASLSIGQDLAGNLITSIPTTGATFEIDNTAPTLEITTTPTTPSNAKIFLTFNFTFDEPVTGFGTEDITLNFAGTSTNGISGSVLTGSGSTYTLTLSGGNDAAALAALTTGQTVVAAVTMSTLTDTATNPGTGTISKIWTYNTTPTCDIPATGSYTFASDCSINSNKTIVGPKTWTINSGVTVTIPSGFTVAFTNDSRLTIASTGKLVIASTATVTIGESAIVTNNGTIENNGTIYNLGTIHNNSGGTFNNNNGAIFNNYASGTFNNLSGATYNNSGTFTNFPATKSVGESLFNNVGTFNNLSGGTFTNTSTTNTKPNPLLTNTGIFTNYGTLNNAGTITNNNKIYNVCGGVINGSDATPNNIVTDCTIVPVLNDDNPGTSDTYSISSTNFISNIDASGATNPKLIFDSKMTLKIPMDIITPGSIAKVTIPANAQIEGDGDTPTIEMSVFTRSITSGLPEGTVGTIIELGDPTKTLRFNIPVKVVLTGQAGNNPFFVGPADPVVATPILACSAIYANGAAALADQSLTANSATDACYYNEGADLVIWTTHFTGFGSSSSSSSESKKGGGGCSDCEPPTLGLDSNYKRIVENGFTYNGVSVDAERFFTAYPLITADIGVNNTAVFKIYENNGIQNIKHLSFALGLDKDDIISNSKVMIELDIDYDGTETVTVTDPKNVLDNIVVTTNVVECMTDSTAECLEVTIQHMFRTQLDFNIVATDVWDMKRNAWQNYFNHGIEVIGESLNPPEEYTGINRGQIYHLTETSKTTAVDEFGNSWSFNHGTWMMDYIKSERPQDDPTEIMTRMHSDFTQYKESQLKNAIEQLLVICPTCLDDSFTDFDDSWSYDIPVILSKLQDPKVQQKMLLESEQAQEIMNQIERLSDRSSVNTSKYFDERDLSTILQEERDQQEKPIYTDTVFVNTAMKNNVLMVLGDVGRGDVGVKVSLLIHYTDGTSKHYYIPVLNDKSFYLNILADSIEKLVITHDGITLE